MNENIATINACGQPLQSNRVNRKTTRTVASLSPFGQSCQCIPWDMLIEASVPLKQTSSLPKLMFLQMSHRFFNVTSKMSG